ncbi:hypothetical protein SRABI80_03109 [Peribacillus frigoritolerans]|uniref:hypothetical protein n=1 Tax=Peribacillus frigoritolerans TaxID=450367 RepID=UPI001DAEFAA1|nr:hypothetical protein [Peribacillus frigoritolerans]CAH0256377.1 hypothetical protein SRABI80_03109 [Peribacillus frigoritolerans]
MGLFTKKTSELETLEAKQGKLQEKAQELQTKISKIQTGLAIAETNLLVDETAANKKQIDKFKVAIEKTQKELEAVQAEISEVSSQIGAINQAEKQAKIDEAAKAYEERVYLAHKRRKFEMKVEELVSRLYGRTGMADAQELQRMAGLKYGEYFDASNPEHARLSEAANKASASGISKAEKEFNELVAKIEAFIELN